MRAVREEMPNRLEGGWVLQGARRLRFVLGDTELAQADIGIVVGREPAVCDRPIDDVTISRRHCRFSLREGRLYIEDLNSLNGTWVDGRGLAPFHAVPVDDDRSVTLARLTFTVTRVIAAMKP